MESLTLDGFAKEAAAAVTEMEHKILNLCERGVAAGLDQPLMLSIIARQFEKLSK
jgi:hypothetical protein